MNNNFELIHITAGKCYDFLKKGQDRVDIFYSSLTGFTFMFYLRTPSADEIREFSRDIKVHLAMVDDFVQFLFEIGNMPVMDCSFHIKMQEGLDFPIDFKPLPKNEGTIQVLDNILYVGSSNPMVIYVYRIGRYKWSKYIRYVGYEYYVTDKYIGEAFY